MSKTGRNMRMPDFLYVSDAAIGNQCALTADESFIIVTKPVFLICQQKFTKEDPGDNKTDGCIDTALFCQLPAAEAAGLKEHQYMHDMH